MYPDVLSNENWALTNPVANYSTNGYPTKINTLTMPSGDGVIPFGHLGEACPPNLVLVPFGVGSSSNTFSLKVLGWRATKLGIGQPLWVPVALSTFAITVGTGTGIAGADLDTTALFATTITCSYGPTFVTVGDNPHALGNWFELSPTSNVQGAIVVPSLGFRFLEVIFTTGGSITSCNALYCKL